MFLDRLKRKKEEVTLPTEIPTELPEDLERFRTRTKTPEPVPELPYGKSIEELVSERTEGDKIELILQKLETIDARLKLIEEKIKRY
jgi:hypothetical protein